MAPGLHPLAARTIDTVVFDLDGTLVDTLDDIAAALAAGLREHGLPPLPRAGLRSAVGAGGTALARAAAAQAGAAGDDALVARVHARYLAAYAAAPAARSRVFPGAAALLARLTARGVALAVCTNKTERLSRAVLGRLELMHHFAAVVGGDTLTRRKPAPEPLLEAIERSGGRPGSALMVGDTAHDAGAAHAAGVPYAWVAFGYAERPMGLAAPRLELGDYDGFEAALAEAGLRLGGRA